MLYMFSVINASKNINHLDFIMHISNETNFPLPYSGWRNTYISLPIYRHHRTNISRELKFLSFKCGLYSLATNIKVRIVWVSAWRISRLAIFPPRSHKALPFIDPSYHLSRIFPQVHRTELSQFFSRQWSVQIRNLGEILKIQAFVVGAVDSS